MKSNENADQPIPARIRLSLLWAALMALYIYNDYFLLFVPGTITGMAEGSMGFLGPYSDGKMIAVAMILAIPASMIFLSSLLSSVWSWRLNLGIGALYLLFAIGTLIGSPLFFKMMVIVQIMALVLLLRTAWGMKRSGQG